MGVGRTVKAYRFKENDSRSICCKVFENMAYLTYLDCEAMNIQTIDIPEGVTSVKFHKCTNLVNVTIPSSVTEIKNVAFLDCTSLNYIRMLPTTPPTLESYGNNQYNNFDNSNNCPIYVPAASLTAYQTAPGWSNYASRIQAIPSA